MIPKGTILNPSVLNMLGYVGNSLVNSGLKAGQFLNQLQTNFNNTVSDIRLPLDPIGNFYSRLSNGAKNMIETGDDFVSDVKGVLSDGDSTLPVSPSASSVSRQKIPPSALNYLNAELAQHYGMSRSTAYQEALSNTAYQRAVKDMQAAGLNPAAIFGSGKGYTAGGVSYVSDGSTGISYGGSGTKKKLFSNGAYHGISTAVGLATAVITGNPANYWVGSYAAQGVLGTLNEMSK